MIHNYQLFYFLMIMKKSEKVMNSKYKGNIKLVQIWDTSLLAVIVVKSIQHWKGRDTKL